MIHNRPRWPVQKRCTCFISGPLAALPEQSVGRDQRPALARSLAPPRVALQKKDVRPMCYSTAAFFNYLLANDYLKSVRFHTFPSCLIKHPTPPPPAKSQPHSDHTLLEDVYFLLCFANLAIIMYLAQQLK